MLERHWREGEPFRLTPQLILELQRLGADDPLEADYRPWEVGIHGSPHTPPSYRDVPAEIEALCREVNAHLHDAPPIHLAAWVHWRVAWIHPFLDGNGRLARVLSHLVLCARLGYWLPGPRSVNEYLSRHRDRYIDALQQANVAWRAAQTDVSALEALLSDALAEQIESTGDR